MKVRILALYGLVGSFIAAGLCGCAAPGASSQFAPASQSDANHAGVHRDAIPAGSIFVGWGIYNSFVGIYSGKDWANMGKITSNIDNPVAMAVNRGRTLFVADYGTNAISMYGLGGDGKYLGSLTQDLNKPYTIALDSDSDVAVLNTTTTGGPRVTVFPLASNYPYTIEKDLAAPSDAIFDDFGDLFVADYDGNKVVEYGPGTDKVIGTITDGIDRPVSLTIDKNGTLWVANSGANDVTEYGYAGLITVVPLNTFKPTNILAVDLHLYISAYSRKKISKIIDYNLVSHGETDISDGVDRPRQLLRCPPGFCAVNAYDVTVYQAGKLVHTIKESTESPRSAVVAP